MLLEAPLAQALARVEARIATLQAQRQRLLEFQAVRAGGLALLPVQPSASELMRLLASNPRRVAVKSAS